MNTVSVSHRAGRFRLVYYLLIGAQLITNALSQGTSDPSTPQDPSYTCSADSPCAVGCCGPFGVCGMGPDFCAADVCVNSCDAKAECDPAGWGPLYVLSETCPLNVCCSQFGFCGTTPDFCGDLVITNPSCPKGISANQKRIGYYEGWSDTRPCDTMFPEQIPVGAYTHLNYGFASIDPTSFSIAPADPGDVALYSRLTGLKALNPGLEVWISIGGWSMNDPGTPTATTFSDLAGSEENQQAFFASLLSFMGTYGFDGVDIDWEYPVAPDRNGRPEDFANYPSFLRNLRSAFQSGGHNYGLSITAPSSFWYLQNFDIVNLEPLVDWFNMMEYDLHGVWDSTDVWIGPYVYAHTNLTEIDESLKLLWRNNIDPSKVVLGMGFYGRSYTLQDPSCTAPGCPFTGAAPPGPCTQSAGTLSFAEIEDVIAAGANVVLNEAAAVKIVTYGGDNWVSYDDAETLQLKVNYANDNCLGGVMVWAVSLDDSSGTIAAGLAEATGEGGLDDFHIGIATSDLSDVCVWTPCGGPPTCPLGTTAAFSITDGCPIPAGKSLPASQLPQRAFCCPTDEVPICRVAGSLNPGDPQVVGAFCVQEACAGDETLVTTTSEVLLSIGCGTGQRNVCCTSNQAVTNALAGCAWTGNAPDCADRGQDAACPSGTSQLVATLHGDGGSQPCVEGLQSLCCASPTAIDPSTCAWYQNGNSFLVGSSNPINYYFCTPGCPPGKIELAVDTQAPLCVTGYGSFCCDPPAGSDGSLPTGLSQFTEIVSAYFAGGAVCSASQDAIDDQAAPPGAAVAKRQTSSSSTVDSWVVSGFLASLMLRQGSTLLSPLFGESWNQLVGNNPSTASATFGQLQGLMVPPYGGYADPVEYINDILCTGADAQETIQSIQTAQSTLCIETISIVSLDKRAEGNMTEWKEWEEWEELEKRRFWWDSLANTAGRVQGQPLVGQALNAVANGELRFEYFRWFGITNGMAELEVVYLLGRDTGNMRTDLMQNSNLALADANRFLMFHIHFAQGSVNGHLVPNAFNIRHASNIQRAQGLIQATGAWWCPSTQDSNALVWSCPNNNPQARPPTARAVNIDGGAPQDTGSRLIFQTLNLIRSAGFPAGTTGDLFSIAGHQSMWRYATSTTNTFTLIQPQPLTQGGWVGGTEPLLNPDNALWNSGSLNGLAFDSNGNLYNPITLHGGDLISTAGFFLP